MIIYLPFHTTNYLFVQLFFEGGEIGDADGSKPAQDSCKVQHFCD